MQSRPAQLLASTAALIGALALSACIPPAPQPTPVPSPAPTPSPVAQPTQAPPQVAAPTYDNWMDAPQTPGDWSYAREAEETLATFGTDRSPEGTALIIRCHLPTRRVGIARPGSATGPVQMRIRTETQDGVLAAQMVDGATSLLAVEVNAGHNLLDAIAFSKGRFAVETDTLPPLYVPAYPEITRVVEDCRG